MRKLFFMALVLGLLMPTAYEASSNNSFNTTELTATKEEKIF